jgi:hypothetical protein
MNHLEIKHNLAHNFNADSCSQIGTDNPIEIIYKYYRIQFGGLHAVQFVQRTEQAP